LRPGISYQPVRPAAASRGACCATADCGRFSTQVGYITTKMGLLTSHKRTAVTSIIDDCCEQAEIDHDDYYIDQQLSSLMDAIRNQKDYVEPGATEAARALRKKMKYGSAKDQFNALRIVDLLVTNGAYYKFMQPLFDDDKLLDRLQYYLIGGKNMNDNYYSANTAGLTSTQEKKLSNLAFSIMTGWYDEFKDVSSLNNMIVLYERCLKNRQNKTKKKHGGDSYARRNTEVPDFMNDDADMDTPFASYQDDDASSTNRPKTNAELDKKFKIPRINYDKEAPKILQLIAEANIMSTNLMNTLNSLQKDELSIHSIKANDSFDECRAIRRKVLRYLQLVQREELLGPLLKCNDELVVSLKRYEEKSVPPGTKIQRDDSDEEDDGDYDSLADYESDNEPAIRPSNKNARAYDSDADDDDDEDDDNGASDRYVKNEEPPLTSDYKVPRKAPPPVPPKSSILRSATFNSGPGPQKPIIISKAARSDYDPFSDDNEVAPTSWA
jgi:LAS seventeen-binding protein 5